MTGSERFNKEAGRRWQSLTAEEKLVYKSRVNPTDSLKLADLQSELLPVS
jgi:hypothetical protein